MNTLSHQDYLALRANAEIIEADGMGEKVLQMQDGTFLKLFRRKRLFSSVAWSPYAQRFANNAARLHGLGISCPEVIAIWRIPSIKRDAVHYRPLPGVTLRQKRREGLAQEAEAVLKADFKCFVSKLHDSGIYFRSLHLGNVVLTPEGQLGLIDIADIRIHRGPLSRFWRRRNLKRMQGIDDERDWVDCDCAADAQIFCGRPVPGPIKTSGRGHPSHNGTPTARARGIGWPAAGSSVRRTVWPFVKAIAHALFTGRFFMRDGHVPPMDHVVPKDFAGVGVATGPDPEIDTQVIAALNDLGIRQVRLDFSYGDAVTTAQPPSMPPLPLGEQHLMPPLPLGEGWGEGNHTARFLEKLCDSGFRVMLHLVQPFDAAARMEEEAAQAEWRSFVADALDRFGGRVEMIEVGSTVNRRRWAGYSLPGLLAAWRIAHEDVRARGLTLAGPNITDFEPPWNIGILALLRERDQLPDIHTDNLFSERCTEPERWDHKILGHRLAPLLRYNLVKKARLLARIGADAGAPRLISPAAFWTLPRIERLLPDSEQKQADYLARYMILCATSGALEREYWGPLVCHREGLIDDGDHPYPALERITHYAAVTGTPDRFRRRPAFHALSAFVRMIPGGRYEGRLNGTQGLEVHAFTDGKHLTHAVWTVNGAAAALADLYDAETLATATCLDRDGRPLDETPDVATESPVYLRWAGEQGSRMPADAASLHAARAAAPIKDLSIHAHGNRRHYYYRDAVWHGMVRARNRTEAEALIQALHPKRIGAPDRSQSLRHARNAIWTVPDPRRPEDPSARLVVKKPVRHQLHKKLLDRFKPSKARRSWNGASELLRRGIGTAMPVAWFEQRSGRDLTQNWYVCDHVDGDLSVRKLFSAYAAGHAECEGVAQETAYTQLSRFLLKMHGRGVFFRDLSGGNILIRRGRGGELEFTLIDTARARFYRGGLPLRKRLADLSRACHKLHPDGRARLLRLYFGERDKKAHISAWLAFLIYDTKIALKRQLRKTLGRD